MPLPESVRLLERRSRQATPEPPMLFDRNPYLGEVIDADDDMLTFIVPAYSKHISFGPARYPRPAELTGTRAGGGGDASFAEHDHELRTPAVPPAGTQILVAFIDGDEDEPYVQCLYGWPS